MPGFLRRVKKKYYKKQNGEKGGSTDQMDEANRAICYACRNPPPGQKPLPLLEIQKMVHKKGNKKERKLGNVLEIMLTANGFSSSSNRP